MKGGVKMKKWIALGIALFFTLSVSPAVFGEMMAQEEQGSQQTLIAKAKKKPKKKKKKKKKKTPTNSPVASVHQVGNTKG
jgi:hypothetical protein